MPRHPLLLFDIDGTLVTGGAGIRAVTRVAGAMLGGAREWRSETAGMLDGAIFLELAAAARLERPHERHAEFRTRYLAELRAELDVRPEGSRALPGVHEMLEQVDTLVDAGAATAGLLTGNYRDAAPLKLTAAGIDPSRFSIGAFGCEGQQRADLTALAMRRQAERRGVAPDPRRVFVIGDTPRDIACAHAHGCYAIAVCTGRYPADDLAAADLVLEDLRDPEPLFALLDE